MAGLCSPPCDTGSHFRHGPFPSEFIKDTPSSRSRPQEKAVDTTEVLADLRKCPDSIENVGMVLVRDGVVCEWARADHVPVKSMKVSHDRAKTDAICREME